MRLITSLFLSIAKQALFADALAPVLILVGVMMASSFTQVDFSDFTNAIPAFLTLVMMPLAYSIADGIISFTVLKIATNKTKEVNISLIILSLLFISKFVFLSH